MSPLFTTKARLQSCKVDPRPCSLEIPRLRRPSCGAGPCLCCSCLQGATNPKHIHRFRISLDNMHSTQKFHPTPSFQAVKFFWAEGGDEVVPDTSARTCGSYRCYVLRTHILCEVSFHFKPVVLKSTDLVCFGCSQARMQQSPRNVVLTMSLFQLLVDASSVLGCHFLTL